MIYRLLQAVWTYDARGASYPITQMRKNETMTNIYDGFKMDGKTKGVYKSQDPYRVSVSKSKLYIRSGVHDAFKVASMLSATLYYSTTGDNRILVELFPEAKGGKKKVVQVNRSNQATINVRSTLAGLGITLADREKIEGTVDALPDPTKTGFIVTLITATEPSDETVQHPAASAAAIPAAGTHAVPAAPDATGAVHQSVSELPAASQ